MLKGFREFMTGSTGSYHNVSLQHPLTSTHTQDYSPNLAQQNYKSPVAGKLYSLVQAMHDIDPFFSKRRNANISGSIDFMSPEMAKGNSQHDDDNLTHLYTHLRRNHPEASQQMRPVVPLFKQFHSSILSAVGNAWENNHFENIEMVHRLDLKSARQLNQAVDNIHRNISDFTSDDMRHLGTGFAQAFQSFNKFYSTFKNVIPQVERHLADAHDKVKHMAWDTSRYS